MKAVSVSQLNSYIGRVLSTDPILCNIAVKGEISNLTYHSSGHIYFSLKDENSTVRCFLPYSRTETLRFELEDGMEITVYGSINVYEKGGSYSLLVRDVDVEGEGNLKAAYEKLKKKLEAEGLFDPAHKRPIPPEPRKIGVVTSPTGAAVRDIISTAGRRNPSVEILIYPALVQGEGSAASVIEGINTFNEKFPDLDLMIIGRGGGSMEDLWTFNEESVARAVYASKIPVISAVGHEIDYVITDYVADLRGATPTAAAELAVPHIENLKDRLKRVKPAVLLENLEYRISALEYRLRMLKTALTAFDPSLTLNKGYTLVSADGIYIRSAGSLRPGDSIDIRFSDGTVKASVSEVCDEE